MWHIWGTGEVHTGFWWGYLRERDYMENVDMGGTVVLEWIFQEVGWGHGLDSSLTFYKGTVSRI
jgi:hypothetical protein